jgi:hypothetical protein
LKNLIFKVGRESLEVKLEVLMQYSSDAASTKKRILEKWRDSPVEVSIQIPGGETIKKLSLATRGEACSAYRFGAVACVYQAAWDGSLDAGGSPMLPRTRGLEFQNRLTSRSHTA